jgi:hypothetical protein
MDFLESVVCALDGRDETVLFVRQNRPPLVPAMLFVPPNA